MLFTVFVGCHGMVGTFSASLLFLIYGSCCTYDVNVLSAALCMDQDFNNANKTCQLRFQMPLDNTQSDSRHSVIISLTTAT
jgi:hypothetical protein